MLTSGTQTNSKVTFFNHYGRSLINQFLEMISRHARVIKEILQVRPQESISLVMKVKHYSLAQMEETVIILSQFKKRIRLTFMAKKAIKKHQSNSLEDQVRQALRITNLEKLEWEEPYCKVTQHVQQQFINDQRKLYIIKLYVIIILKE